MVNGVQHSAPPLPPSPPNSVEEPGSKPPVPVTTVHTSESEGSSAPVEMGISESDDDHLSPFARLAKQQVPDSGTEQSYESASPVSSRSGLSSLSRSSAGSRTPGRQNGSIRSRGMSDNTYISAGTSLKSSTVGRREPDNYSTGYSLGTTSASSMSSSRHRHKPSRLRHEVPRSPDDNKVHDLFKFTRTRLSDIPYKRPMMVPDNSRLTNDHLRRQMLSTIFGWQHEVNDLIRDEMTRYPAGSASRILLAKWLGDMDADFMAGSSENMTSSDWMLLALSGIGGQQSQHKLGRAYVQRLLESGDIHVAVTIMLGMGDHNDAIEVYVSHKRYMEALILTCVAFPGVWERQAAIIRKWGEWAVQHGQQQLAIRCFACTDQESSEPWTSPSAAQLNFQSITPSIPEVLSPPLSPPGAQRGPQRSIAKSSALKLITSFGDQTHKSRFYSQGDGGQTPIAAGVTPIADSAISPGGSYEAATAFLRPSSNSRFNTPTSARAGRGRLPSIGEVPLDLNRAALQAAEQATSTAEPKEGRQGHARMTSAEQGGLAAGMSLQRAATASPMMMRDRFKRAAATPEGQRPLSPDQGILAKMKEARSNSRNGSRDRIPRGVNLHVQTEQTCTAEVTSPEQSVSSSTRFHWPTRRRGPGSVASSLTSNSSAGRSLRANLRHREDYIHSLDVAQNYPSRRSNSRHRSKERSRESSRGRHGSRERRTKPREMSDERGRTEARSWTKPKRSPTSPIPMSPEDLANLSTARNKDVPEPLTVRKSGAQAPNTISRTSSRGSNRRIPEDRPRPPALDIRGRSARRETSQQRSPSSPLPLSASALHYQGSEDEEDFKRAMQARDDFRARHGRSSSRGINSPATAERERSKSRRREATELPDGHPPLPLASNGRAASTEHAGDLRQMKDERQRKKEQAARELEERRKSLAKRPQAPQIPHPNDIRSPSMRVGVETADLKPGNDDVPPRSATEPPRMMHVRSGPPIGLPATPKAMRLMMQSDHSGRASRDAAEVPPLPLTFAQRHSPNTSPDKEKDAGLLALLPSTVYQPPGRPAIPRSMSAPIPDESHHPRGARKASCGDARGIDEVVNGQRRRSHEEPTPPPPPPPPSPPVLKELQHLAVPPPPPPAPLPHAQRQRNQGAVGAGMIEIVMDDEDNVPIAAAPNDGMVPVIALPAPPSKGHRRGRSSGDGSLSGRLSKATERLRSASRGRKDSGRSAAKSPFIDNSPMPAAQTHYLVSGMLQPVNYGTDLVRSPIESKGKHIATGLHHSEMI